MQGHGHGPHHQENGLQQRGTILRLVSQGRLPFALQLSRIGIILLSDLLQVTQNFDLLQISSYWELFQLSFLIVIYKKYM